MSRKCAEFTSYITNPLNVHNFVVDIPGFDYSILVKSTSFPSEQLREVTLHYQGEEIRYPTIPETSHTWNISIDEDDSGLIRRALESLKQKYYDQKTGLMVPRFWDTVEVFARDLAGNLVFSCKLHGVWIKGRSDVSLNNSDPTQNWAWEYQFIYQWIEDVDKNNPGNSNPLGGDV